MSESKARLTVWNDGAYACTTHDARTGTRMLIQYDGRDATRICRVAPEAYFKKTGQKLTYTPTKSSETFSNKAGWPGMLETRS